MSKLQTIELLAPAKNLIFGKEAINHGADAVYIGAPAFGARASAGNTIEDIEALVKYAHLYAARVHVALNTSLFDNELEEANRLVRHFYDIGVDAVIIQDPGLLETDLPPIALHASTQMNNYSLERIKFLEKVGFQRIILARELSLEQIAEIRANTTTELECFVQGALCVSFSGQCYLSQCIASRSGNRGVCSQPCRSSYNLYNAENKLLVADKHLLSLKDFNASQYLADYLEAGVCSFKIEGRLKDLSYVKNVTAYYRRLIDGLLEGRDDVRKSSSGSCVFSFTPDVERTFNRGFTDYFLKERKPMASLTTQKSIGKRLGKVVRVEPKSLVCKTDLPVTAGDGLCFKNENNQWEGFLVNRVDGQRIFPNNMPSTLKTGAVLYRNNDYAFEKALQSDKSAVRRVGVRLVFSETENGFSLQATDEDGISASTTVDCAKNAANNPDKAMQNIETQLSKSGETVFMVENVENQYGGKYFIPVSVLNQLRRECLEHLQNERLAYFHPGDTPFEPNDEPYFTKELDFRANILNQKALDFYKRHGVEKAEFGVEKTQEYSGKPLMTTKYCLRYELGQCLVRHQVAGDFRSELFLENNGRRLALKFDCKNCQMQIFSKI